MSFIGVSSPVSRCLQGREWYCERVSHMNWEGALAEAYIRMSPAVILTELRMVMATMVTIIRKKATQKIMSCKSLITSDTA